MLSEKTSSHADDSVLTQRDAAVAIRVENLSKCYQLYDKPQDRLRQTIYPRVQKMLGVQPKNYATEFWALKNVSFEVKRGGSVGIIGSNGSGKSTLLQLISGTLDATAGKIDVRGRVGALLELGAGFNPEFTGRENVHMAASLYGLSKRAIDERFDRIAAFADIGQFIEQPIKTYSSGMFVRLAFAVIAHIDADILVVDEALAVGDAVFTQKCMRFIRRFQRQGTLLFVSHDISAVQNLCETVIWLAQGEIQQIGPAKHVAESYLQYCLQQTYGKEVDLVSTEVDQTVEKTTVPSRNNDSPILDYESQAVVERNLTTARGWKTGVAEIVDVTLSHAEGGTGHMLVGGERVRITVRAKAYQRVECPILGFLVRDRLGQDLFGENTLPFTTVQPRPMQPGQEIVGSFVFRLPMLPNGHYAVLASFADGDLHANIQHHWLHDALIINVSSSKVRYGLVGVLFEDVSLSYS
ncbi:MAG TPA: ABC transporter ATP-binding protein [Nitrospira sp.]|nr:ABC transporter ATP-binding protein [Nitrospira sp.]